MQQDGSFFYCRKEKKTHDKVGEGKQNLPHRQRRSPRRKAAPVAVRAANYVDVITKIAPQLRGFIYGRCGRYVDSG